MKWGKSHSKPVPNENDTNTRKRSTGALGFFIGTRGGLFLITALGLLIYLMSYTCDNLLLGLSTAIGIKEGSTWVSDIQSFIRFLGETFISAGIISLIMTIHTINETHQQVRDNLLLDDPSFIERYSDAEINKLLGYSIRQKLLHNMGARPNSELAVFVEHFPEIFSPIVEYSINRLGGLKFYCKSHYRNIKVTPIRDNEYNIEITFDVLLSNLTKEKISYKYPYRFIYISQQQINSFKVVSLKLNDTDVDPSIVNLQKIVEDQPATQGRPFNHIISFEIPINILADGQCHFILKYEYKNYTYGCLITYSLPFVTQKYQEVYSLVGTNAKKYHLQVVAYSPFTRNHCSNQDLVQKDNEQTYSINASNWGLPGTGFVAVVRKK